MSGLRALIDGKAVDSMDNNDVFNHLKNTKQAKMNYDLAKTQLHTKLAPTRQMLELIDQEHPLDSDQTQEIDPVTGQPVQQQQNNVAKPGQQMNPNSPRQQTNQNLKKDVAAKPAMNKSAATNKPSNKPASKSPSKKKDSSGRGFEVHVKAQGKKIDQMNVRKKKMKGNDYHDTPQLSQMPSRGIGLSSSRIKK